MSARSGYQKGDHDEDGSETIGRGKELERKRVVERKGVEDIFGWRNARQMGGRNMSFSPLNFLSFSPLNFFVSNNLFGEIPIS